MKKTTVRLVHYRVQCTVGAKFLLFVKMFIKVASFVLCTVKQVIRLNSILYTLNHVVCYNKKNDIFIVNTFLNLENVLKIK